MRVQDHARLGNDKVIGALRFILVQGRGFNHRLDTVGEASILDSLPEPADEGLILDRFHRRFPVA